MTEKKSGIPIPSTASGTPDMALSIAIDIPRLGYKDLTLATDLNLTLAAGQITCLLGPSGVGKSSLLKTIAGLIDTDNSGLITCSDGGALAGRLSYMAQSDLLLPWASVAENLAIGFKLRGESASPVAIADMLEKVGLRDKVNTRPAELSGGMRQRVALARTLLENRDVVLMDEPFSSLDALTRHNLQDLTGRLLASKTVLLVTHDPMEALRLGHRIFILSGSPARLGDPVEPALTPPRDNRDSGLQQQYSDLMQQLTDTYGGPA